MVENLLHGILGMPNTPNYFSGGDPLEQRIIARFQQTVGGLPRELLAMFARIAIAEVRDNDGATILPGHVKMPTTADEAAAMALLGEAWLKENAPDRLRPTSPDKPPGE